MDSAVNAQEAAWRELYVSIYRAAAAEFARGVFEGIAGKSLGGGRLDAAPQRDTKGPLDTPAVELIDDWQIAAEQYVGTIFDKKWEFVAATTKRALRSTLADGIDAGEGADKLRDRVRGSYSELTPARAERIARTEVGAASNFGAIEGAKSTRLPLEKEWIDAGDARVRPAGKPTPFDHVSANGQRVPMDDPFTVSGEKLMFPLDTSLGASAGNVIQCRCVVGFHVIEKPVRRPRRLRSLAA